MAVLDRNWRCEHGEIDIVARDGDCLVVCEVKTRRSARVRRAGRGGHRRQGRRGCGGSRPPGSPSTPRGRPARCASTSSASCVPRAGAAAGRAPAGGGLSGARPRPGRSRWSGSTAHVVDVEADIAQGLPRVHARSGCPIPSLRRGAATGSAPRSATAGHAVPPRRITVNLSPAVDAQARQRASTSPSPSRCSPPRGGRPTRPRRAGVVHLGELGLDGRVRAGPRRAARGARGRARRAPRGSSCRARTRRRPGSSPGVTVHGAALRCATSSAAARAAEHGRRLAGPRSRRRRPRRRRRRRPGAGPRRRRRPAGGAAARSRSPPPAGTTCCCSGRPGAGKTMLAERLPGLLPALDRGAGARGHRGPLGRRARCPAGGRWSAARPFVAPHHTATMAAVVGGGSGIAAARGGLAGAPRGAVPRRGAGVQRRRCSRRCASRWSPGEVVIAPGAGRRAVPGPLPAGARGQPVPVRPGHGTGEDCTCTPMARRRYLQRLSGPLLDRVDLQVRRAAGDPGRLRAATCRRVHAPWSPRGWRAARGRRARAAAAARAGRATREVSGPSSCAARWPLPRRRDGRPRPGARARPAHGARLRPGAAAGVDAWPTSPGAAAAEPRTTSLGPSLLRQLGRVAA